MHPLILTGLGKKVEWMRVYLYARIYWAMQFLIWVAAAGVIL